MSDSSILGKNRWLIPIEGAFRGIQPEGLKVACPRCGQRGLLITRWIKGPRVKPVYVMHKRGSSVTGICELDADEACVAKSRIALRDSDIRRFMEKRRSFILFSGGKDSLATVYYLKSLSAEMLTQMTAIYVETTVGLPQNIKYIKKVCRHLELNLEVVKPNVDYFTLAKDWGIPSHGYRWCCRELKIKPIQDFLRGVGEEIVVFDGIRAAESNLRKTYIPVWYHPGFRCVSVSPIFSWSDEEVYSTIHSNGIPAGLLDQMNSSAECWCGAYKSEADFIKLFNLDREFFDKLAELETSSNDRFTYILKNGKKKPLRLLRAEIIRNEKPQ